MEGMRQHGISTVLPDKEPVPGRMSTAIATHRTQGVDRENAFRSDGRCGDYAWCDGGNRTRWLSPRNSPWLGRARHRRLKDYRRSCRLTAPIALRIDGSSRTIWIPQSEPGGRSLILWRTSQNWAPSFS